MKDFGKIIFYLIATLVLGALLAAPLYWGGQWIASHGFLSWLAEVEFRKFFHRGLLIAAIALLCPTARWVRVPNVRALGLEPNSRRWSDLGVGFAASFVMMAVLGAVLLSLGVVKMRGHFHWGDLGQIAVSAIVVSILEEWLFRGAILGLLNRAMNSRGALLASSALFSILHFLKPDEAATAAQSVGWLSGFALIPGAFAQFKDPLLVLSGFTTLFCVGWILGWARLKTRSLWMSIGLHAGWVLGIMGFAKITKRLMKDTLPWFGENLQVGLGSVIVVLITGGVVWVRLRNGRSGLNGRSGQ
ncbi:MAG: CPBP family intramembrane glutamic endopeptidase [Verrucomicrobiota bacterium]